MVIGMGCSYNSGKVDKSWEIKLYDMRSGSFRKHEYSYWHQSKNMNTKPGWYKIDSTKPIFKRWRHCWDIRKMVEIFKDYGGDSNRLRKARRWVILVPVRLRGTWTHLHINICDLATGDLWRRAVQKTSARGISYFEVSIIPIQSLW